MKYLAVYLDFGKVRKYPISEVPYRIDKIMARAGLAYKGFNFYCAKDGIDEDEALLKGRRLIEKTNWLKESDAFTMILVEEEIRNISDIKIINMDKPREEEMRVYENYYKDTGQLADPIVLNQEYELLDGYTSYLLAEKYHLESVRVIRIRPEQKFEKCIMGRFVQFINGKLKSTDKKYYIWRWDSKEAVVCGDCVQVDTQYGKRVIQVKEIDIVTGDINYKKHKKARKVICRSPSEMKQQ